MKRRTFSWFGNKKTQHHLKTIQQCTLAARKEKTGLSKEKLAGQHKGLDKSKTTDPATHSRRHTRLAKQDCANGTPSRSKDIKGVRVSLKHVWQLVTTRHLHSLVSVIVVDRGSPNTGVLTSNNGNLLNYVVHIHLHYSTASVGGRVCSSTRHRGYSASVLPRYRSARCV